MTPTPEAQERTRRYLLGQLIDGAREEFEQELLVDDGLFEELQVVEDELIDEYLAGELPHHELVQFEQHFLGAPDRQEKVRFARALNRYVTVATQRERTVDKSLPVSKSSRTLLYRAGAAFAVVILIAGMILFLRHRSSSPETFATLNLTISQSTRGEGAQPTKVTLPLNKDALKIVLRLADQSPATAHYRVELETDNGQNRYLNSVQDGQSVTVVIPADEVRPGLYSLKVFTIRADGGEQRTNGNYSFTVE